MTLPRQAPQPNMSNGWGVEPKLRGGHSSRANV
ncbi:hypothetical protein QFZ98_008348 [Paraburkholderia youngii]